MKAWFTATFVLLSLGLAGCVGVNHDVSEKPPGKSPSSTGNSLTILPMVWDTAPAGSNADSHIEGSEIMPTVAERSEVLKSGAVEITDRQVCTGKGAIASGVSCVTFDLGGATYSALYRRLLVARTQNQTE